MKLATFLLAAALLAGGAAAGYTQPAYPLRPNTTTNRFTDKVVATNTFGAFAGLPAAIGAGNFTVRPVGGATPKVELTVRSYLAQCTATPPGPGPPATAHLLQAYAQGCRGLKELALCGHRPPQGAGRPRHWPRSLLGA
jgi:hypothetical protein